MKRDWIQGATIAIQFNSMLFAFHFLRGEGKKNKDGLIIF